MLLGFVARGLCHLSWVLHAAFLVVSTHPCHQAAMCMDRYRGGHEFSPTAAMSHYRASV